MEPGDRISRSYLLYLSLFIFLINFDLFPFLCTLKGKITDSLTIGPLRNVNVKLIGTSFGAVSDTNGNYSIRNIPPGYYDIKVSLVGHKTLLIKKLTIVNPVNIKNFSLQEVSTLVPGVLVKPDHFRSDLNEFIGSVKLDQGNLKRISGSLDDVIRSVSILPGVAQISNYYNDLIVNGGGPTENLFVLDGIEVSNINHYGNQANSGGVLSFINLDYINSISFSSGGFSPLYGDKISSAMEINLKNGDPDHIKAKAVISATQFAFNLDGPVLENTSFIVSARRSYLDLVFKAYGFTFTPQYYDFLAKINSKINNNNNLSFLFIGVLDDIKFFDFKYDLIYANSRALGSRQMHYITGISYKNIFENGFFNLNLSRNFLKYESIPNVIFSSKSNETEDNLKLDLAVKLTPKSEVDLGAVAKVINYNTDIRLNNYSTSFDEILNIDSLKTNNDYIKSGFYFQFNQLLGSKLKLNFGVRLDFFDATNENYTVSPRIYSQYNFSDRTSLALSFGIYNQTPEYLWISANSVNEDLRSIMSKQIYLEFEHRLKENIYFKIGGFLKKYLQYPSSLLRPYLIMNNTGTGPTGVDDNFAGAGLDPMVSQGEGIVKGAQLFVQRNYSGTPLWGSLSLTYSKADFQGLDKVMRPGSFDQRWNVTLTAGYIFNDYWELDAKFRFSTGVPYTPFDENGMQSAKNYNSARIEDQHSLDLRLDRKWFLGSWKLRTFLDVQNVFNHKVRTLIRWDKNEKKIADDPVLGIVPSLGISLEF